MIEQLGVCSNRGAELVRQFNAWSPGDVAPVREADPRVRRVQEQAEFLTSPTGLLLDAGLYRRCWASFAQSVGELHRDAGEQRPEAVWTTRPGGPLSETVTQLFGEVLG